MAAFSHYIGIDYSGAEPPESILKGLRVYCAVGEFAATEVAPPPSPRKYWTLRGIAYFLAERHAEDVLTIIGIDHGFSFPLRYFEVHRLLLDSPTFLDGNSLACHRAIGRTEFSTARSSATGARAARIFTEQQISSSRRTSVANTRWRRVHEAPIGPGNLSRAGV